MTNPPHPHDPSQQAYQQPMYQQPPQPGMYQPGYPVQPPKKKSKVPIIIVGIAVAILVICGIAAVTGGGSDSADTSSGGTSTAATQQTTTEPEKAAATIGTPVRDGKFEFVVTGIQQGLPSVGDNPILTQKAQGQFVVVSLTVKNTSKEPHSFSPTDQKLLDSAGATFDPDTSAQIALGATDIAVWDNINPGNTVTVKLVFDMPEGATPTAVELHDSMFSDGVKVSLTK